MQPVAGHGANLRRVSPAALSHSLLQQARTPCAKLLQSLVGELPRLTFDTRDELRPDALERANSGVLVEPDFSRQQRRNILSQAASELFQHALFGHSARDLFPLELQIVPQAGYQGVPIQ